MPMPEEGESQKDFVSRCIPMVINEGAAKDSKQAAAMCFSMYKKKKKKKMNGTESSRILEDMVDEIELKKYS